MALHVTSMARGRRQKALPWVANFATNLCHENEGILLTCLGTKNVCTLLLAARVCDNLGKPFGKVTVLGDDRPHGWSRPGILWTFRQGLWNAPSSRSLGRLCLCEAKRQTFLAKRPTFVAKHTTSGPLTCGKGEEYGSVIQ